MTYQEVFMIKQAGAKATLLQRAINAGKKIGDGAKKTPSKAATALGWVGKKVNQIPGNIGNGAVWYFNHSLDSAQLGQILAKGKNAGRKPAAQARFLKRIPKEFGGKYEELITTPTGQPFKSIKAAMAKLRAEQQASRIAAKQGRNKALFNTGVLGSLVGGAGYAGYKGGSMFQRAMYDKFFDPGKITLDASMSADQQKDWMDAHGVKHIDQLTGKRFDPNNQNEETITL